MQNMKNTLVLLLTCFIGLNCIAQNEASNWYFGENAGISFNANGSITELTDGQLNTVEGCTTISDANGNLLFYTDGITVWDRLHRPMPNANGSIGNGLFGDPSSTQSAIVIPKPKDPNIYYIFTVDTSIDENDPDYGFNYSIVDMTLNGAFGDVTSKNINLLEDSSEKISAVVKDCETEALWIITFASENGSPTDTFFNTFHAYAVTETGINTTPESSTFNNIFIQDPRGYLKLSPDGTKIACANATSGLYLYDFDVNTGKVSNQVQININFSPTGKPQSPYGVEFSQNNNLLYVSAYYNPTREESNSPSEQYGSLLQYNLTAVDINSSEVVIDNRQMYRGGLQLGPDGRIYRAMSITYPLGSPFLSVINVPNALGLLCDYKHNAINLSRNSRQGLPPFITSFFAEKVDIIGNNSTSTSLQLCDGDRFPLKAPELPMASYFWSLNGIPLTESGFELEVSSAGLYKVFIDLNTNDCSETFEGIANVTFNPNPVAYDTELIQCDEDGILGGFTRFDLNQANEDLTGGLSNLSTRFFTNASRDSTSEILTADNYTYDTDNPSPIYVEVYNTDTNCFDTSILTLNLSLQKIDPFLYQVCDKLNSEDGINTFVLSDITTRIQSSNGFTYPITYYKTQDDALLEENNLEGTSYINTSSPYSEIIYARVENNNACFGIAEVLLQVNVLPDINVEDLTYYCINFYPETITLNAGLNNNDIDDYFYTWSNSDSNYETQINEAGTYTVTVTHKLTECAKERTIIVDPSNSAVFSPERPFEVKDVSQNNTITVFVSGEGTYQYKLLDENDDLVAPYQDSNVFENVKPGIYQVIVNDIENNCGEVSQNVSVIGFPKYFTPNNDGFNDTWQLYGVSSMFQPDTKILIYDRYGKLVKEISPIGKGWNGTTNGKKLPSDDYWFSVTLQDGRIFKNHFTLKY